jgi:hypothetical protein
LQDPARDASQQVNQANVSPEFAEIQIQGAFLLTSKMILVTVPVLCLTF